MFNKCPHCGASYMDDDAELCPSCEQPLKGEAKPKKKAALSPAAQAAAKKKEASAKKPAAEAPAAPAKPKAKPSTKVAKDDMVADDDPFDIGERGNSKAIRVHPKPAKGRMVRVECPMCESPGFIAPAAQGKEVRCWNKECRLPVFQAPEPTVEEEPEPEKSGVSPVVLVLAGLLLAAVAGGAYYFTQMQPEPVPTPVIDPVADNGGETVDPDAPPERGPSLVAEVETVEAADPLTPAELRDASLAKLPAVLRDRDNSNRNDSVRRAAEAYLLAGKAAVAKEQIAKLSGAPSYQLPALVMLAEQGDMAALKAAVDVSGQLPSSGRQAIDWATALAAQLVRSGDSDTAARLMRRFSDSGSRGEYSALRSGAEAFGTFDIEASDAGTLIGQAANPQWVAVTRALLASGDEAKAATWAGQGGGEAGDDALTAWAGTMGARREVTPGEIAGAATSEIVAARMLAAAGVGASEAGRSELAAELLRAALAKLPAETPAPMSVPGVEAMYRSRDLPNDGLPEFDPVRTRALAALKIAELQAALGQQDAALDILQAGIEGLRAAAPAPLDVQKLVEGYENDRSRIESELRSALKLRSGSEASRAFNAYRKQVDEYAEAAQRRFELQQRLARAAASIGDGSKLIAFMDGATGEPWWSSATAAVLAGSDNAEVAAAAKSRAKGELPSVLETWTPKVREAAAATGAAAVRAANSLAGELNGEPDPHVRGQKATTAAVRLVEADQIDAAAELVRSLKDAPTREDVLEMATAKATTLGRGERLINVIERPALEMSPSELIAAYRGAVAGAKYAPEPAVGEAE